MKKRMLAAFLMLAITISGCGGNKEETVSDRSISSNVASVSESVSEEVEITEEKEEKKTTEDTKKEGTADLVKEDQNAKEKEEPVQVDKEALAAQLVILQNPSMYTYDNMLSDTEILSQMYPDLFTKDSIGITPDGREMVHYVVGNPQAEKQIFINGAIHAREYLTFQLVMKQMVVYMQHIDQGDTWGNLAYKDMWNQVAIHVVPVINPDGVQISQFGLDGINSESLRQEILTIASMDGAEPSTSYFDHWKANAEGVDLNRNFDAYWESYEGTGNPSSDHYKGFFPGSAPEAAALISLTLNNNFLYTISYHTQGHVIYWNFENIDPIYDISRNWVNLLSAQTGYYTEDNFSTVDPAGYSDWAIYRCQIPSVVIEVCVGESPYLSDQFEQVWAENQNIWELTVQQAMNR